MTAKTDQTNLTTFTGSQTPSDTSFGTSFGTSSDRPSRDEAEEAVRTLLRWIGEDPGREGLVDTPKRVVDAYGELFAGYNEDPAEVLSRTFEDVGGYNDLVLLKNIRVESHCEHHMMPIVGMAHVAYLPGTRVVGLSKIARVIDIFGKRLQTQETMTAQVAETLFESLEARGVAVMIDAGHACMTHRGVHKSENTTITKTMLGAFKDDPALEEHFLKMVL